VLHIFFINLQGQTALYIASQQGQIKAIEVLVKAGADLELATTCENYID